MDTRLILDYLSDLEENNNQAWFQANKARYEAARDMFEALLIELSGAISVFDPKVPTCPPRKLTFKLQRDTRFSHDKRPYNAAMRAHIGPEGKAPIPCGYYIHIQPGNASYLGGGLFAPIFADATRRIRDAIAQDGGSFEHVLTQMDIPVQGEILKRTPKGYDPDSPQAPYLRHKSWYVEVPVADTLVESSAAFIREAAWTYAAMQPFNAFLNHALEGFEMPTR